MTSKDYIKRYKGIYKNIPESSQAKAERIIEKLADVLVMMDECQKHIEADGLVTEMSQGNYSIERESPWSKVYDQKAKLFISFIDKLDKMMPDAKNEGIAKAGESLAQFVAKGKRVDIV